MSHDGNRRGRRSPSGPEEGPSAAGRNGVADQQAQPPPSRARSSPWPVLSALTFGALVTTLTWWSNDQASILALGSLLGAVAGFLSVVGGWIWDVAKQPRRSDHD